MPVVIQISVQRTNAWPFRVTIQARDDGEVGTWALGTPGAAIGPQLLVRGISILIGVAAAMNIGRGLSMAWGTARGV